MCAITEGVRKPCTCADLRPTTDSYSVSNMSFHICPVSHPPAGYITRWHSWGNRSASQCAVLYTFSLLRPFFSLSLPPSSLFQCLLLSCFLSHTHPYFQPIFQSCKSCFVLRGGLWKQARRVKSRSVWRERRVWREEREREGLFRLKGWERQAEGKKEGGGVMSYAPPCKLEQTAQKEALSLLLPEGAGQRHTRTRVRARAVLRNCIKFAIVTCWHLFYTHKLLN